MRRQIFPQRRTFVFRSEAAAPLQFGDEEVDDVHHVARCGVGMRDHETAAAPGCLEFLFHEVRELRWRARDRPVVAGRNLGPEPEELLARDGAGGAELLGKSRHEADRRRLACGDLGRNLGGTDRVRQLGEVVADVMREVGADALLGQEIEQRLLLGIGLALRVTHDEIRAEQDADGLGVTPLGHQCFVERLAMLDLGKPWRARGKDVVGKVRRGLDAARRAAGLDQHRATLRRRHGTERSPHLEELTGVVDRMDFFGVADHPGLAVPDERVRLDAVPQRLADVDELLHPVITRIVLHQFVEAVIGGIGAARRGDDVEGHAPPGHDIERIEQPRHIERMHEGGRISQPEADMFGDARHRGDVGRHILPGPLNAPARAGFLGPPPCRGNPGAVAEEDHVQTAALAEPRKVLEHRQVRVNPMRPRARRAPASIGVGEGEIDPQVYLLRHCGPQWSGKLPGATGRRAS